MNFQIVPHTSPFCGTIRLPGDKSISHRALILASMSDGVSTITGLLESDDVLATRQILEELGTNIESLEPGKIRVHGRSGLFLTPQKSLDCKNSGTTMRLLAGLLAGQLFSSQLIGDESLSQRPMERVIAPLRQMGATISAQGKRNRPPIIVGNSSLSPLHDYTLPVASAQLKSALLLAALFAKGTTTIIEPTLTRDHTERLFELFQISFQEIQLGSSKKISLTGPQLPKACNLVIPGDLSSAAFWIVAAMAMPGSLLQLDGIELNPTRTGFISILKRMGATITQQQLAPQLTIHGTGRDQLQGTIIKGIEIPGLIDELPILAVAGALAQGTTIIRDAQELRVKETDRIAALIYNLRAMGVSVLEYPDGLEIKGGSRLQGASLKSFGDHRIAMAFSIAALFAQGPSTIDDVHCIANSYPAFTAELQALSH